MFGGGEWGPDVAKGDISLIASKWQGFNMREGYLPCPVESFNEKRIPLHCSKWEWEGEWWPQKSSVSHFEGVTSCSKCVRGVMVDRKPLCLAFQAEEGFVVGVISLHLLEMQEGGLWWAGKPSALHFWAEEGSEEREVVLNYSDSTREEGSSLIVSKCAVLGHCVSR